VIMCQHDSKRYASRQILVSAVALILFTFCMATTQAQSPNVGFLKVVAQNYPRQVSPSSNFTVSVDVEYAVRTNATLRAAAFSGPLDATGPELWHSTNETVSGGGDKIWAFNLIAPSSEGTNMEFTFIAYYLDNGTWRCYNDTTLGPGYTQIGIKVASEADLRVDVGSSNQQISIGNLTKTTDNSGAITVALPVGREYQITVPLLVELGNSTRLKFNSWEDGSNQTSRVYTLDGDSSLVASYRPQYLVQINSVVPTYSSSLWYDKGANVTLHIENSIPMSWPLGALGLKYSFLGWSGAVNSRSTDLNFRVNGPMIIDANFTADYSVLYLLLIPLVGVLGGTGLLVIRKRGKSAPTEEEPKSAVVEPKICTKCGEPVEKEWNHCIRCGAKLASSETIQDG